MSKNTKIIIGVIAGVLVLCMIACVVSVAVFGWFGTKVAENVTIEGEGSQATQAEIAELDMPARFTPLSGMSLMGIKMVVYKSTNEKEVAVLMGMPVQEEINDDTLRQLQEGMGRSTSRNFSNMKTIETRDVTIRGESGKVIIQEGTDDEGTPYRLMMTAFQGQTGIAMLMIGAPTAEYDQAEYDAIIESIR